MKIVFLGTPDFAVASLQAILQSHHQVLAVVTAPDALGGRGKKELIQSDVKKYALSNEIQVLQPEKLRNKEFIQVLKKLNADIFVVVAFRMLPQLIWDLPTKGTINVHGSLLPKYRGAAPIHWAVINGETETGVTIFKLKQEIDTGDIIAQAALPIGINDTTGEIYNKLMVLGAKKLIDALDAIESGKVDYLPQLSTNVSPAPKLFHEQCSLDLNFSDLQLHNKVRGLNPKPSAWLIINEIKYFIHRTKLMDASFIIEDKNKRILTGNFFSQGKLLYLKTKENALEVLEIQPESKRKMTGEEFARGIR